MKIKRNSPIKKPMDTDFYERETPVSDVSMTSDNRSNYKSSPVKYSPEKEVVKNEVYRTKKSNKKSVDIIKKANAVIRNSVVASMKKKKVPTVDLGTTKRSKDNIEN